MVAEPAWPVNTLPRLYVEEKLSLEAVITPDRAQAHYLLSVMRFKMGSQLVLFDNLTGEWLGEVIEAGRKHLQLKITHHLNEKESIPDLWLLTAPIKKGRIDWIYEKACELGVARITPVITQRTIVDRVNLERLQAHIVEAAEQCGRTSLSEVTEARSLKSLLAEWPEDRALFFADETGGEPMIEALSKRKMAAAILVGPEGGFTDQERDMINAVKQAVPVSLGPRILRADTAAIAATALWMAAAGDWQKQPRQANL
ncbi:16S rRNA (uracil(1498)-N(3))-methyltransferase [Zymomonas mobilis]|uniref:16S rRNA (uracil(1498)-N(3))-methyltransferase n=1 Tax=Zymomonas mobilis TaxID=542 RepID=UPI0039EAB7D7